MADWTSALAKYNGEEGDPFANASWVTPKTDNVQAVKSALADYGQNMPLSSPNGTWASPNSAIMPTGNGTGPQSGQGAYTLNETAQLLSGDSRQQTDFTYGQLANRMGAGPTDNPELAANEGVPMANGAAVPQAPGSAQQASAVKSNPIQTPGALTAEQLQEAIRRWQTPAGV
jgi:hypothetical protein